MTERVRVAVIGLGYFGAFHTRHFAANDRAQLVAVVDRDGARSRAVSEAAEEVCAYPVEQLADYRDLKGRVDAVSIAAPTSLHHAIARECLEMGLDTFIEKPICETVAEADGLIALAKSRGRIVQVGHIERQASAYQALRGHVTSPTKIEARRISPFRPRAIDVDVVSDLMIHDIDLVLDLVGRPVESVSATAHTLVNKTPDHVTARLEFAGGCSAELTASRVGFGFERALRVFEGQSVHYCDLAANKLHRLDGKGIATEVGDAAADISEQTIDPHDNLGREIAEFLECCISRRPPMVDGPCGRDALAVAQLILAAAESGRVLHPAEQDNNRESPRVANA
ncbi:MAG: Gfo/Idh/MocA family oxidoreductase [Pseudomonadota bacterium]